eukprot:213452-Chlamydomonas_euryale.AAC.7
MHAVPNLTSRPSVHAFSPLFHTSTPAHASHTAPHLAVYDLRRERRARLDQPAKRARRDLHEHWLVDVLQHAVQQQRKA